MGCWEKEGSMAERGEVCEKKQKKTEKLAGGGLGIGDRESG